MPRSEQLKKETLQYGLARISESPYQKFLDRETQTQKKLETPPALKTKT